MGKGKIAAQCCHATLGVYRSIIFGKNEKHKEWLNYWENTAEAKIALKIESEEEMLILYNESEKLGLPLFIIMDAGRTQIKSGSKTVLAIGIYYIN